MKVKINFYSNILWRIFWLSLRKIFFRKIAILAPQLCPPLCLLGLLALLASLPPWFCQQQWRPQFAGLAKLPQSGWRDTSAMQQSVSSDPVILHSICLYLMTWRWYSEPNQKLSIFHGQNINSLFHFGDFFCSIIEKRFQSSFIFHT